MVSDESGTGTSTRNRSFGIIYLVAGLVYVLFSVLHFVATAMDLSGPFEELNVPSDPITGVVMLIASVLFLTGSYRSFSGMEDARAYGIVGWFMGALVSFVGGLVILSNAFRSTIIGVEDMAKWTFSDDIVPGLYLGSLVILMIPVVILHGKGDHLENSVNRSDAE